MLKSIYLSLSFIFLLACNSNPSGQLVDMDAASFQRKMNDAIGKKVTLVNFWATWCAPCVKEFPHLVKLGKKYEKDLNVVFLSFDFPEKRSKAVDFLNEQKVPWESYLKMGDDQAFFNVLPDEFSGALPFTLIYDKAGNVVKVLKGEHSEAEFEKYILEAINRKD
jgi:thiol-disulfide isomerase/thioredoxin